MSALSAEKPIRAVRERICALDRDAFCDRSVVIYTVAKREIS